MPLILAPAGNKNCFLAAIAAGADAVYCGLKLFSARMEAKNFTLEELARITGLAHDKGVKVYLALNSLLKPGDIDPAAKILKQLDRWVKPDALIIQDLSIIQLAKQAEYSGEIHLSTLSNVSFPRALKMAHDTLGVHRVVIPRELHIDEIKTMAAACPKNLGLEIFVHGALCYGVSGRCYWSSYLGGKSGLRGQCVQPCRRQYGQNNQTRRYFSCRDLSLDVLVKVLLEIPNIVAWKIEGRKKSPHYVYYTTQAYRLLRDHGRDPQLKKSAVELLERALGRPGTHFFFLPQRPYNPVDIEQQTGSGMLIGRAQGGKQKPFLIPREALLPGDALRVGYQNEPWHKILRVNQYVPKKGRYDLKVPKSKFPAVGTPVFLIDRREKALQKMISALNAALEDMPDVHVPDISFAAKRPAPVNRKGPVREMPVYRMLPKSAVRNSAGVWLSKENETMMSRKIGSKIWRWLPPVIWPDEELAWWRLVQEAIEHGGKNFVLNAPWQIAFFDDPGSLNLWAGPFCNIGNPIAVNVLKSLGFSGVIVSPELAKDDYSHLSKYTPLPLGVVTSGNWPLCLSRILSEALQPNFPFISPEKEAAWAVRYDACVWIYPNWKIDLRSEKKGLQKAGYQLFINLLEPVPETVNLKNRSGKWNWDLTLY